jgi:3-hydroxyacyl-CoA dehydrogenase/enoyl-CoA hydratase/3-hydroxybutyryl-CoA epimerase
MSVQFKTIGLEDRKDSGVKLQVDGEHAEVILDTPGEKVNKLTRETWTELQEVIGFIRAKSDVIRSVIFRSGKPDSYLAGADITTIEVMKTVDEALGLIEKAQEVFQELAELPQMTVAVIDGACMGGGTELALACKYRIISDSPSTRLGLPEVQLGVLPGAGGTQRLPRLVGVPTALQMISSGAIIAAERALEIGAIDETAQGDLEAAAIAAARRLATPGTILRRTGTLPVAPVAP